MRRSKALNETRDPEGREPTPRSESRAGSEAGRPRSTGADHTPDRVGRTAVRRLPYAAAAYIFVGLAFVGVVVPGLPTFPFLLLAAWAAARGSKRLHDWLYEHPRFGAALIEWEEERAVSRRSKVVAVALMAVSWLIMLWRYGNPWVMVGLAALFTVTGGYVVTRPEPSRRR